MMFESYMVKIGVHWWQKGLYNVFTAYKQWRVTRVCGIGDP